MPINLAGGYAAGGVKDALLEIVKQRMLEQELAQREEENQFQRLRANRQDTRQSEQDAYTKQRNEQLDKIAEETRTQQNEIARFNVLNKGDMPQADINASLGEDLSTAHVIPTTPDPGIPASGGQTYTMPAVPIQSNRMQVAGMKIRPMSMEMNDQRAAADEQRKLANDIARERAKLPEWTNQEFSVGGQNVLRQVDKYGNVRPGPAGLGPKVPDRAPVDPLTHELLQGRLDEQRRGAAPINVDDDVQYTMKGNPYVSADSYDTSAAKEKARADAHAKGIPFVNPQIADGMRAADTARANLDKMLVQIQDKLPKDAAGRVMAGPGNQLAAYFQTDADKAAFGAWRTAAIQTVQALAEKGMGLRINRGEIDLMLQNDIPQITDDLPTARKRLENLNALLDSKEDAALQRDRRSMVVPGGLNDKGQTPGGTNKTPTVDDILNKARSGRGRGQGPG
jgi:hypothetical protein